MELYNLDDDLSEERNLAESHADLVQRAVKFMDEAHVPHASWKVRR